MQPVQPPKTIPVWAILALIAVQLFDVAIHIAVGQLEPIRVLSNALLAGWAAWTLVVAASRVIGLTVIILYLALNGWFLAANGLTNPLQGDALRMPLFFLVGLSAALAIFVNSRSGRD